MTIRKLLRKRKPIIRQFILSHDPRFPRNEQYIHAAWRIDEDLFKQSLGYFLSDPPRFVPCPHLYAPQTAIGMTGVEKMCGSTPWENIIFWAPFRGEGMRKHVKTRKVKV